MLRLRTFGGLTLEKDGVRLDELIAQRKVLALLAVLARAGKKGVGRERLMALLWADSDMERARGSLKQMLHSLRRQLDPEVVTGTSELQLNGGIVSSDVADFSRLIATGDLKAAVELYHGPFLDGVHIERAPDFSRWEDAERAELQREYLDAVESLARRAENARRYDDAVSWWLRALSVDPLRGRSVIGVMSALEVTGDRAGALRHAQAHEDQLREELGSKPDPDVSALAERIRASERSTRPPQQDLPAGYSTATKPAVQSRRSRPGVGRWLIAGGIGVVLLAAALLPDALNPSRPAAVPDGKRAVVAMFANQTGDSSLNSLQLLAADWVTRGVSSTPGVDMLFPGVLYNQGRTMAGTPVSALELAKNNGAQLAISGTFYRSGDSLHFAATLIDVATGKVLRALGPFGSKESRPLEGIEKLRQGATVALASMHDARISSFVSDTARLPNLEAYQEFLRGEELHWRGDMRGALPHFGKAGQLDSAFLLVAARMAITAANASRCDVVDSIADAIALRRTQLSQAEKLWIESSIARCNGDLGEVVRHAREQLAADPRQPLFKYVLAVTIRRANRPAEAARILETIDVDRDLGWLRGAQRLFYWREVLSAEHALGDYESEWKHAEEFAKRSPGPLMGYFYKARSFAGRSNPKAAVQMADSIQGLPSEAVAVGAANHNRVIRAASTGWVMYGISEDLLAHGHPAEAKAMAKRTIGWVSGRTEAEKQEPEYRLMHARALMLSGGHGRAFRLLSDLVAVDTANVEYRSALGRAAALLGDSAAANRIARSLATVPKNSVAGALGVNGLGARTLGRAQIASALGDTARALALLDSLPSRVHPTDFLLLHSDPAFAPLRDHPRFKAFIKPKG